MTLSNSQVIAQKRQALAALDSAVDDVRLHLAACWEYCAGSLDETATRLAADVVAALERADLENALWYSIDAWRSAGPPDKET